MKEKLASFAVPLLTAVILLYQVLANLQIALTHDATLFVIGTTLAIAAVAGVLAAFGPGVIRMGVLAASTLVLLDVTLHLPRTFDRLKPESRGRATRGEQRISDIHQIKAALDEYVSRVGPLPSPGEYGEAAGKGDFWANWWDVSSDDGNGDHHPFLDFLIDGGILSSVPVDPVNEPAVGGDPRGGKQYVYFLVPPEHDYAGGACESRPDHWTYMLGITDMESEASRSPAVVSGSGCACLWRDHPNFFQMHFDYVLCGSFDATPESRARAAEARAARATAALVEKQAAEARAHAARDTRRVEDLHRIQQALETYVAEVGPLPAPLDYGEAEASRGAGFWHRWWDVSTEDGDGDGNKFLDFLVDSGTMTSVPVDPDNEPDKDGDPRGGRQYVYFVVPPDHTYLGGSCAAAQNQSVYMLGITDLRSEFTRPPKNVTGSGCECLWREHPDFFKDSFDYMVCGTFRK